MTKRVSNQFFPPGLVKRLIQRACQTSATASSRAINIPKQFASKQLSLIECDTRHLPLNYSCSSHKCFVRLNLCHSIPRQSFKCEFNKKKNHEETVFNKSKARQVLSFPSTFRIPVDCLMLDNFLAEVVSETARALSILFNSNRCLVEAPRLDSQLNSFHRERMRIRCGWCTNMMSLFFQSFLLTTCEMENCWSQTCGSFICLRMRRGKFSFQLFLQSYWGKFNTRWMGGSLWCIWEIMNLLEMRRIHFWLMGWLLSQWPLESNDFDGHRDFDLAPLIRHQH